MALWQYAALGLLEPGIAYGALDIGLRYTSAASAALLDGLQSCFVVLMGALILGERVTLRSGGAAALAGVGVVVLSAWHVTLAAGAGDALVLLGSLAASLSVIAVSRMARDADALELTAYQFGFGFLWSVPLAGIAWLTRAEQVPGASALPYLATAAGIGLVAFLIGYLLYNYAVARVPVLVAGMALNLIPVFGVIAAAVLLAEAIRGNQVVGGALILAGLALCPYGHDSEGDWTARVADAEL